MISAIARTARAAAILSLFVLPSTALAHDVTLGDLTLASPFTRAMPPTAKVGGGYVTITNNGTQDDRLVSASSPAAPVVQVHEMRIVDDVMKMRELPDGIAIPAGETVSLEPGGLHIMFMNVPTPFAEGETVPATLTFEQAGAVAVEFHVEAMGATRASHGHAGH